MLAAGNIVENSKDEMHCFIDSRAKPKVCKSKHFLQLCSQEKKLIKLKVKIKIRELVKRLSRFEPDLLDIINFCPVVQV